MLIIVTNDISSFIDRQKLSFLLQKIWRGPFFNELDGKISHYSKCMYMSMEPVKSMPNREVKFNDLLMVNFKPNVSGLNFWYQYKYRRSNINYTYLKDFLCATFLVLIFQYINYTYLDLFKESNFTMYDT